MVPLTSVLLNTTNTNLYLFVFVLLLILASAFFSACETAFSTINPIRIKKLADENVKGARKALNIVEHYDKTLSSILVGNNLVNIANTTICAYIFSTLITNPTISNILNTVIMTVVILIFGEITPKSLAKINAEKFALKFSMLLFIVIKILYPITFLFYKIQKGLLIKVKKEEAPTVTEDDLESIIDTMEEEGVLKSDDADMFMGVFEINEKTVYDIMTPRVDVIAVNLSDTKEQVNKIFLENGYSRVPVYEEDKDHMIGILNYKDYFKALLENNEINLKSLMTETTYVAENMKVKDLIRVMQKEKKHLAIVLDEYGGTSGIVTMEDALEEVVGEIYDEHDDQVITSEFKKISDKTYEVDAKMELTDLFEELEIEHLPETEYTTVGGFLYELAENLPALNQVLEFVIADEQQDEEGDYVIRNVKLIFKITEIEDRRIRKVVLEIEQLTNKI